MIVKNQQVMIIHIAYIEHIPKGNAAMNHFNIVAQTNLNRKT